MGSYIVLHPLCIIKEGRKTEKKGEQERGREKEEKGNKRERRQIGKIRKEGRNEGK